MNAHYLPPSKERWSGRSSEDRAYIHENIALTDLGAGPSPESSKRTAFLLGYACDEGVRRNHGRTGASAGPTKFREALGKMPWHRKDLRLTDAGDWEPMDRDMEGCQQAFSQTVSGILEAGGFSLGIGGGHDMAFAHYQGIRESLPAETSLGILNLDAHLDMRQPNPAGHSGSPFYQMAQACKSRGESFLYGCIGARKDANPSELLQRAEQLGVRIWWRDQIGASHLSRNLKRLEDFLNRCDHLYLSIDLDGFSSAFAPGVSAASPMGYSPAEVMPFLDRILESGKLCAADLAELNPACDRDGQTAVLAASLAHWLLHHPGLLRS